MGIIQSSSVLLISELLERLSRLPAAVVRVVGDHSGGKNPTGFCTGWFLTPNRVIIPGYALNPTNTNARFTNLRAQSWSTNPEPWESPVLAEPELLGQGLFKRAPNDWAIALLRLEKPWEGPLLPFSFETPQEGDPVSLLQFLRGQPPASVSFGQMRGSLDDTSLLHDASTGAGSGGAPVLDRNWRVLGMHMAYDGQKTLNVALTRAAILEALQASSSWAEISTLHRIADTTSALELIHEKVADATPLAPYTATSTAPIWPALEAAFNPKDLSETERQSLQSTVVDPHAARWVLRPEQRRSLLESAGSLPALSKHLRPGNERNTVYRLVKTILQGPPYDFSKATEDELAWLLQISRWFEGLAPRLPTPAQFAAMLGQRRIRAPLERAMSRDFRGRESEIGKLEDWYKANKGPLLLTGIGGIGKSALIARFALHLPENTLLLWLDFDRPDLAPDDAVSVLSALAEQATARLESFTAPSFTEAGWESEAVELGKRLASALPSRRSALLVLDSFEAAQYAVKYQELWRVLEAVAKPFRALRVAVSGRAPVPGLTLRGQKAIKEDLKGLAPTDARAWLRSKGIRDTKVLKSVVDLAKGVPLILRLAIRFIETGNKVEDLPAKLPAELIAGYLYDRILDRVQRPDLKPLARGALVLRRLTLDMLKPVLQGLVDFPPGNETEWFRDLSSEMSLVEGSQTLTLRQEVRSATLRLLEQEEPKLVRSIDERAASWYASRNSADPTERAELVYHQLRLGDLTAAAKTWTPDCAPLLKYAEDEIRDDKARAWLKARIGNTAVGKMTLTQWEEEAVTRILNARARRLNRSVSGVLRERSERSTESPLIFHDAFELREREKQAKAVALLESAKPASGSIERNRLALRALLANDACDPERADEFLNRIDNPSLWTDRPNGALEALCVQAARVWIRTDLDAECKLITKLTSTALKQRARRVLAPVDVALPRLRRSLSRTTTSLERSVTPFEAGPTNASLLDLIDGERTATLQDELPAGTRNRIELFAQPDLTAPLVLKPPATLGLRGSRDDAIARLAQLGWNRWRYLSGTHFLRDAIDLANSRRSVNPPMEIAILGTLALFATPAGTVVITGGGRSVADSINANYVLKLPWQAQSKDWTIIKRLLAIGIDPDADWDNYVQRTRGNRLVLWPMQLMSYRPQRTVIGAASGLGPLLLSVVSRDPLTQLVSDLAGRARDEF